ncbi:MAG: serpin family protein [Zavarzinella sp.]
MNTTLSRRNFLASVAALAASSQIRAESEPVSMGKLISAANNKFATDLYPHLNSAGKNLFFSPYSIESALSMTAAGARGETLAEMVKVLQLPAHPHAGFKEANASLISPAQKKSHELAIANALWGATDIKWNNAFQQLTAENYGAGLIPTNFQQPEAARTIINQWVEKQTREKIKDLLPKGSIDASTAMVLTNAIYFKGTWMKPFEKRATIEAPFTTETGKKVEVPMMRQSLGALYRENDAYQVLELDYKGNEMSMVLVLPSKTFNITKLEKSATGDWLNQVTQNMRFEQTVQLKMPRFKLETNYRLNDPLQDMGMKLAFVAGKADFSGMHDTDEKLFISLVIHKAFVDVNEEGSEAAAATGVVMGRTSAAVPRPPKVFDANRPFLFFIRNKKTNMVLFAGKVADPS